MYQLIQLSKGVRRCSLGGSQNILGCGEEGINLFAGIDGASHFSVTELC